MSPIFYRNEELQFQKKQEKEAKLLSVLLRNPAKTRNRLLEDFDSFSQTGFSALESRLQSDLLEQALNGRNGPVVAVFEITNYEL